MKHLFATAIAATLAVAPALGRDNAPPIHRLTPAARYGAVDPLAGLGPEARRKFDAARASGALETLPNWTGTYSVDGTDYSYTFVGSDPANPVTTTIPVAIVPLRLTVTDANGGAPTVFDANDIVGHVLASPLFQPALANAELQFSDAMLRVEFPEAQAGWHLLLVPRIAPTIDVTLPADAVKITRKKSGKLFGLVTDASEIDKAIGKELHDAASPQELTIFITYDAAEKFAYGYHSFHWGEDRAQAKIYIYSSWLEDIARDAPDAVTLSHEIVEAIHDPLLTSVTRPWGDAFNHNKCHGHLIEEADAVENAPLGKQFYRELGLIDGRPFLFTLQNMALLPWFERQTPSSALNGAYSFPSTRSLRRAAPLDCVK